MLRVVILGAGAGGGFPQWNCRCDNCERARRAEGGARPLTQSSLAVTADDRHWVLLNASPDLRQQIAATPCLHPQSGLRGSPIAAVVLTNADVDHVAGLLTLREAQPLAVLASERVHAVLAANSIFAVLDPAIVERRPLPLDRRIAVNAPGGGATGLFVEAFAVPGKVALWLEERGLPGFGSQSGDTIGVKVSDEAGAAFFYVPGCAALPPDLADRLHGAELVFFDGTTFTDDEMIRAGLGSKTAARMGHMPMSGPDGTIAAFAGLAVRRKVFIHINNSNPVLLDGTPERQAVETAGWQIGHDGMEFRV